VKNILIISTVIIIIGGGIFLFFQFNKPTKTYQSPTQTNQNISPSPLWQQGDINHDGHANALDKLMIKKNFNCQKINSCWKKVIGKTNEGDNPIYVSDLDLNHDGVISNKDMAIIP